MEKVKKEIERAVKGSGVLCIKGYEDSKGGVCDYVVQLLPDTGYKDLVQESLDKLPEVSLDAATADSDVLWAEESARSALAESFQKTLSNKHPERKGPKLEKSDAGWFYYADVSAEDDNAPVVLKHMRCLEREEHKKKPASTRVSKPEVQAKRILRSQLPISDYIGMLVLKPGKFKEVVAVQ